ncbi:MAG: DUF2173 family protein [candidate division Zixibacteria bacterium]|nr:DUF2173 family protein [candidate division Zixibacteria bacterium]
MIGLDRIMERKGVIAAGQFSEDGKVIRAVGNMSDDMMTFTAQMCSKQTKSLEISINQFSRASNMEWRPLVGWAVWAGQYAIVVMGNTGIFVDPKYADLNQLMVDLLGSEATGYRQMNY